MNKTKSKRATTRRTPGQSVNDSLFSKLQATYQLESAQQIQLRIIFNLLVLIIEAQYGDTAHNKNASMKLRRQWQICEKNFAASSNGAAQREYARSRETFRNVSTRKHISR